MPTSSTKALTDTIHQAIGNALDAWSRVEHSLESLFVALTSADVWDAHLIMASIVSFDARLKICNTLMGRHRKNFKTVERWDALYNKLDRKYRKRSELAHGSVVQLNDKTVWIPYYSTGQSMREMVLKPPEEVGLPPHLSTKEIEERALGFRKLAGALSDFNLDLRAEQEQLRASRAQEADQAPPPDQSDRSPKGSRRPRRSSRV